MPGMGMKKEDGTSVCVFVCVCVCVCTGEEGRRLVIVGDVHLL